MSKQDFTIKRKGISSLFLTITLFLIGYPFIHNYFFGFLSPIIDKSSILFYLILSTGFVYLLYRISQFTVKVTEDHVVINHVATVPYQDITKVYVGRFSFIESFEERDKLPLLPFKDKSLEGFFLNKSEKSFPTGYFMVLHTPTNLFFIKASYFDKKSFIKLLLALDGKNVQIEAEESFLKEKAF